MRTLEAATLRDNIMFKLCLEAGNKATNLGNISSFLFLFSLNLKIEKYQLLLFSWKIKF
jgi:hypothetical protein